jgi:hypothetical protein
LHLIYSLFTGYGSIKITHILNTYVMRLSVFIPRFFTTFPFIFPVGNLEVSCILLEREREREREREKSGKQLVRARVKIYVMRVYKIYIKPDLDNKFIQIRFYVFRHFLMGLYSQQLSVNS